MPNVDDLFLSEPIRSKIFNASKTSYKILEIHCYGGLSPWETLWMKKPGEQDSWRGFENEYKKLRVNGGAMPKAKQFLPDRNVWLGPSIAPFIKDSNKKLRILALRGLSGNENCSHEFATTSTLTGIRPIEGRRGIKLAQAIQSTYHSNGTQSRNKVSAVIAPKLPTPKGIGYFKEIYASLYQGRELIDFTEPCDGVKKTVKFSLEGEFAEAVDKTGPALRKAKELLRSGYRYVAVMDIGLQQSFTGWSGYDTHPARMGGEEKDQRHHLEIVLNNTHNLFSSLHSAMIDDDVLIVVNTDMGRHIEPGRNTVLTPSFCCSGKNDGPITADGRNHWVNFYVAMLMGGPLRGRGISGDLKLTDGVPEALPGCNPADVYAACLIAAGINPFAEELLPFDLFEGRTKVPGNPVETMNTLCREVFGLN